jgi:hypothetical protein
VYIGVDPETIMDTAMTNQYHEATSNSARTAGCELSYIREIKMKTCLSVGEEQQQESSSVDTGW